MAPPVVVAFDPGYDGPIRITVTLGPWRHDIDGANLIELVDGLLLLADRGAFVRPDLHPVDALARVRGTRHAEPTQYIWEVDVRGVDHRFAQIFRNQMAMFEAVFCPVAHASLEMTAAPHPRLPRPLPPIDGLAVEEGKVYPERSRKLGFGVAVGAVADYSTERRAEVELTGMFDDDTLARFREWFDHWAKTLDCAYASSEQAVATGRCAIWDFGTDILDDVSFETTLGYWGAPECAWDSYVNLVGRVDAEMAKVAEVRIY